MPRAKEFVLAGGNAEFNDRQKQLFDQLKDVEKSLNKDKDSSRSDEDMLDLSTRHRRKSSSRSHNGHEVKRFRGRESMFKAPNALPRNKFRRPTHTVPDYHKNPSKWTKYSLEDSPDVTHKSNSQAALSFLNQLRNQNKQNKKEETMEVDQIDEELASSSKRNKEINAIVFKKKVPKNEDSGAAVVDEEQKPFFRNSKMIMPECVVGEKPKKAKERKVKKDMNTGDRQFVKLGHLDENEEED